MQNGDIKFVDVVDHQNFISSPKEACMNTSLNDTDFRPASRFNPLEIAEQIDNRNEQVVSMLNSTRHGEMLQEMMTK